MSQQVSASHTPNLKYQKKNLVELREALIDDTASSEKFSLLGVLETLRLLSLHLFSGLCVRVLNSDFHLGPLRRSLLTLAVAFAFLRCNRLAQLPRQRNVVCPTKSSILTLLLLDPSCGVSTSSNGANGELLFSTCRTSHLPQRR